MSKEIVFSDKILWTGLGAGLLAAAGLLFAGESVLVVLAATVLAAVIAPMTVALILSPVADYMVLRNIDGVPRMKALALAVLVAVVGVVVWFVFDAFTQSGGVREFIHDHPGICGAALLALLAHGGWQALQRRRERSKMKTIDLSRSRDIQIK